MMFDLSFHKDLYPAVGNRNCDLLRVVARPGGATRQISQICKSWEIAPKGRLTVQWTATGPLLSGSTRYLVLINLMGGMKGAELLKGLLHPNDTVRVRMLGLMEAACSEEPNGLHQLCERLPSPRCNRFVMYII